jgi:hypothetical protein
LAGVSVSLAGLRVGKNRGRGLLEVEGNGKNRGRQRAAGVGSKRSWAREASRSLHAILHVLAV